MEELPPPPPPAAAAVRAKARKLTGVRTRGSANALSPPSRSHREYGPEEMEEAEEEEEEEEEDGIINLPSTVTAAKARADYPNQLLFRRYEKVGVWKLRDQERGGKQVVEWRACDCNGAERPHRAIHPQ
jgi:hypothetical protein